MTEQKYNTPPCPKGVDEDFFKFRHKVASEHFIKRVKERYNIDLTLEEYNTLLIHNLRQFKGIYKKTSSSTIGVLKIKNVDVWCLHNSKLKLFITAFPPIKDIDTMIRACFPRPTRFIAYELCEEILNYINSARYDFANEKEAALHYYMNCNHPKFLMRKFKKGTINSIMICRELQQIIEGNHPTIGLKTYVKSNRVLKINNEEIITNNIINK